MLIFVIKVVPDGLAKSMELVWVIMIKKKKKNDSHYRLYYILTAKNGVYVLYRMHVNICVYKYVNMCIK